MVSKKESSQKKNRPEASTSEKKSFPLFVKLFTGEKFLLKNIQKNMKISELKVRMEFATGVPSHIQQLSYLDEGELLDNTDIRSNVIIPGTTLQMRVFPVWRELIEACVANNIDRVFQLGVTQTTTYHTPACDYMRKRARRAFLKARGFLALFIATHRGHEKLVRSLIEAGADVKGTTPFGRTPLHVSAAQGHGLIARLLLEKGADIDAMDRAGETAFMVAAKFGQKSCERHMFYFQWQERTKHTKPCAPPPEECKRTRLTSQKKRSDLSAEETAALEAISKGEKLPTIREQRAKSGPTVSDRKGNLTYDEWLGQKKSAEQKIIDANRIERKKKQLEDYERKQMEYEKIEWEKWFALKEAEATAVLSLQIVQRPKPVTEPKQDGYLRTYLQFLDGRKRRKSIFSFEEWLDNKEETVLGINRKEMTYAI